MSQLSFPSEPQIWRSTPTAHPSDAPFIAGANIAAGWLLDIVGPFFWVALIVMFVLSEVSPPG
jgi:hypothetical protein